MDSYSAKLLWQNNIDKILKPVYDDIKSACKRGESSTKIAYDRVGKDGCKRLRSLDYVVEKVSSDTILIKW